VRESDAAEAARHALGARLAAYRRAAGYSQAELARRVGYSRSTIANVETGRQHVPSDFWTSADDTLQADGALNEASAAVEAAARRVRTEAARQARPFMFALASTSNAEAAAGVIQEDRSRDDRFLDIITAAAEDARTHAEKASVTEIGLGTVEQLTTDVIRLSRAYVSAPPLPLFAAMHRSLRRIHTALDRKTYPAQAQNLNFLAGALCGLMANASLDLDREEAADDLARAAWAYARVIDHHPLMGWARGTQALAAIWGQRYTDAVQHAEDGLTHLSAGRGAARLHAIQARALAVHGHRAQAAAAIAAADQARTDTHPDELHDGLAGEFAFDDAKLSYYGALSLADAEDLTRAGAAAETAVRLYQGLPARNRSYGCAALAQVQLARVHLMRGNLEEAAESLGSVLALDPHMRIGSLQEPLETIRQQLHIPAYRSSATARQLERQLAAFNSTSAARALPRGQ
jgi:transcriptional regulator with XRE-family HTH domain